MSESTSRSPGPRSAQLRLLPLALLAAAALTLTACGQASVPERVDPAGVSYPDSAEGSASGLSTSDGGTDVEDQADAEDSDEGGTAVGAGGGPAPTEVTTEQITGPVGVLEVGSDSGRVTVLGSDSPTVTVKRSIFREPDAPVETVRHEGDLLHIESECEVDSPRGPCRIDYEVTVPRATAVTIGGASGDLSTTGLTGPLTARSASGSILVGEHQGATTVAQTVSGDVEVRLGTRPESVEATAVSGNVRVVLPDAGPYRVQTGTVTGDTDVDVRTDPGARSAITARSTSGDLSVGTG